MDWAKIFFCLYLAISNGVSLNTKGSKKENVPKIEKLNSTVSNSTRNHEDSLEESPSETIRFKNPIIFREHEKDVPVKRKFKETLKNGNNQARSAADLNKEANEYSTVLSFTPNPHRQWQMAPEIIHYREPNEFRGPIPIIESQSFVNKPRMSSRQVNYSPPGNLEGRNFESGHGKYPEEYSHENDQRYPEPENNPGRGHTVHTETTHDYGRFLPVEYKSKIEHEAEALIKQQKAQNSSNTGGPEPNERGNNQRAPGYYSGHHQPVNTAFFHKGGFENAHKLPEDHHDSQRHFYTPEKYTKHQYTHDQRQPVTSGEHGYSYSSKQPITSTETYKSRYTYPAERYPFHPNGGPPNAPRQYDLSTEKYSPTYTDEPIPTYHETTPYSPRQYGSSAEQPLPQYHEEEKKFLTPYNENLNQPLPHTEPEPKEYQRPYSNNPAIESPISQPDPPHYIKHAVTDIPHSNEPYTKAVDDVPEEKDYYNTFKSLMDMYKSLGFQFQPFSLDDIPMIQPPRFALRNPFDEKFAISNPLTVSSEDFLPNSNSPKYPGNADSHSPTDQSYDHPRRPYSNTNYNKEVNGPVSSYYRDASVRGKYPNYYEQVPFDSNRSPVVSTEHYDSPGNPNPELKSQVESPKETFVNDEFDIKTHSSSKSGGNLPSEGIKVKGIRLKDYDSKNYFDNPSQKNVYNSAESDFSSSASLPDTPTHSHSVVRKNPYEIQEYHSEEARTTHRPRVYRQRINVEDLNPVVNSAEIRSKNYHSPDKTNKFHSSKGIDSSRDVSGSFPVSNEDQNKYSLPDSEEPKQKKSPQGKSRSQRKSKTKQDNTKGESQFYDQNERSNRKRKTEQNHGRKSFQGDFSYSQPEERSKSGHTENQESRSSKRNGKRSSQRSPKKQKHNSRSQRDHMRAEGSTYHWGMERHKGTDGFFQYANVPGAKAFEYGYRMGGPEHTRERHHKTKGTHSKIKVNWEDENGDTGDHYWEFNHDSREDDTEEKNPTEKEKSQA